MYNNTKKTICGQAIFLSILLNFIGASQIEAASPKQTIKEGNLLYEQGNYIASEKKYKEALEKDTESDIINFNLGTALYKKGEYGEAVDHFQKVYLSEDDQLRLNAYYNSGNAFYKIGISEEQKSIAALAIPSVEKSLKQYERALEIDENDEDVKHNYAFVQKELIRLQKKQQQDQQKKDQGEGSGQSENQEQNQQSQNDQGQEGQENQQQQQQEGEQASQQDQQKKNAQGSEQEGEEQSSEQASAQEGEEGDNNQQSTSAQPLNASELTLQEAQTILRNYQQTEEPQQLLNMQPKVNNSSPVLNDW